VNPDGSQVPNLTPMWAAADDMVDRWIKHLHSMDLTTSDLAMMLLGQENENIKLNLAITAATALQRLAAQTS